jgi:dynein assembly factor 1, axonemal
MRDNQIADPLSIVPFFSQLSTVTCLYLAGNPAVRLVSHYRREMTVKMPGLYYLDDKPIFEDDRLIAEAFARGGKEEEVRVKLELE